MMHLAVRSAVALVAVSSLTGCGSQQMVACADWVQFDSPQDMYDEAQAVFLTSQGERVGTTAIHGTDAHTYKMQVEEVLKGDLSAGDIRISSMPITCTEGDQYPNGDPLASTERIIVFASKSGGEWFTMTPEDGTLPYEARTVSSFQR